MHDRHFEFSVADKFYVVPDGCGLCVICNFGKTITTCMGRLDRSTSYSPWFSHWHEKHGICKTTKDYLKADWNMNYQWRIRGNWVVLLSVMAHHSFLGCFYFHPASDWFQPTPNGTVDKYPQSFVQLTTLVGMRIFAGLSCNISSRCFMWCYFQCDGLIPVTQCFSYYAMYLCCSWTGSKRRGKVQTLLFCREHYTLGCGKWEVT